MYITAFQDFPTSGATSDGTNRVCKRQPLVLFLQGCLRESFPGVVLLDRNRKRLNTLSSEAGGGRLPRSWRPFSYSTIRTAIKIGFVEDREKIGNSSLPSDLILLPEGASIDLCFYPHNRIGISTPQHVGSTCGRSVG